MASPSPNGSPARLAGGFPIAAGVLLGRVLGFVAGQPTIGFFVGLVLGVLTAILLWRR